MKRLQNVNIHDAKTLDENLRKILQLSLLYSEGSNVFLKLNYLFINMARKKYLSLYLFTTKLNNIEISTHKIWLFYTFRD